MAENETTDQPENEQPTTQEEQPDVQGYSIDPTSGDVARASDPPTPGGGGGGGFTAMSDPPTPGGGGGGGNA